MAKVKVSRHSWSILGYVYINRSAIIPDKYYLFAWMRYTNLQEIRSLPLSGYKSYMTLILGFMIRSVTKGLYIIEMIDYMWLHVVTCGCMWLHVTCGHMWLHVFTCGQALVTTSGLRQIRIKNDFAFTQFLSVYIFN